MRTTALRMPVWALLCWLVSALLAQAGAVTTLDVGPGTESLPVVAVNTGNGQFMAVWYDTTQTTAISTGAYEQVVGRRIDASGKPVGGVFLVSQRVLTAPTLGGGRPAVVYNSKRDEFLVIYDRTYDGSTEPGIYSQRVTAEGLAVGDEVAVSVGAAQQSPRIAYDAVADRYLAVWVADDGIRGQFLDGAGAPIGKAALFTAAGASNPALVFSPSSRRYLLAYEATGGSVSDILGLVVSADGSAASQITIAAEVGAQSTPGATLNSQTNQFFVTWTDARDATALPAAYGQLIADTGALSGGNVRLAPAALAPRPVFSAATQRYLLVWGVNDPKSAQLGFIRGRIFKPGLAAQGAAFFISTETTASRAALIANPAATNAYAVWAGAVSGKSAILGTLLPIQVASGKLTLAMTAEPTRAKVGDSIQYTLRINNKGGAIAKAAVLQDKLPASLQPDAATSDAGQCLIESNTVRCDLGDINAGASVGVTVSATATGLGKITNTANLSWNGGGSTTAKISAKAVVNVSYPGTLVLLSPNGGETLAAGGGFPIAWRVDNARAGDQLRFALYYALSGASTWTRIAQDVEGDSYPWPVNAPVGNKSAKVKVVGYFNGKTFGKAVSANRFQIEVVKLTSPNGGEQWHTGQVHAITWTTYATRRPVAKATLAYSLNGRGGWKKIADVEGNPGGYDWTVPPLSSPGDSAKLRVILKDARGVELGADTSDGGFGLGP